MCVRVGGCIGNCFTSLCGCRGEVRGLRKFVVEWECGGCGCGVVARPSVSKRDPFPRPQSSYPFLVGCVGANTIVYVGRHGVIFS